MTPRVLRALCAALLMRNGQAAEAAVPSPVRSVVSPRAQQVSITIYRDHFALITETRELDLPAEAVRLEFQGVVETLLPQSAVLLGAGRTVVENNYRYDPLTPATLLLRSVGEQVEISRTNRKTGRVTRVPATLVAVADGVVVKTAEGAEALHCSGLPEQLTLARVPEGLTSKPTLSIDLAAGAPGRRTLKLGYIAHGFDWSADYLAHLDADGRKMRLEGWATLDNYSDAVFRQAEVQLVAGTLNALPVDAGGSIPDGEFDGASEEQLAQIRAGFAEQFKQELLEQAGVRASVVGGCYALRGSPPPPPRVALPASAPMAMSARSYDLMEAVVVTSTRRKMAEREQLADYQLYRLPERTDLAARQTKQVAFLDKPAVPAERFYRYRLPSLDAQPEPEASQHAEVMLGFNNQESAGLGEPLPGGRLRVFESTRNDEEVFVGEAQIEDKAVGLPVEISFARALDLELHISTVNGRAPGSGERLRVSVAMQIANEKMRPVLFEIRHGMGGWRNGRVSSASRRVGRKYGDFTWRFSVPAGASESLQYQVEGRH